MRKTIIVLVALAVSIIFFGQFFLGSLLGPQENVPSTGISSGQE